MQHPAQPMCIKSPKSYGILTDCGWMDKKTGRQMDKVTSIGHLTNSGALTSIDEGKILRVICISYHFCMKSSNSGEN